MMDSLFNMMGETFKNVHYALFPKTIKYKRIKDGTKMSTNGIILQVTKTPVITAADFRAEMAEKWQKLTAKNGGTLFGKTFICSTKQRIVQNLNDSDCPIDIISGSGEEIDAVMCSINIKTLKENN
jgi:hypothetical protein